MWTEGPSIGPAGTSGILGAADHAINRLKTLGISSTQHSRLERARTLVQDTQDRGSLPNNQAELAEATRTIYELYWVSRALGTAQAPVAGVLREKLALVLTGPNVPDDETDGSIVARSTQFELFVGGWLAAGGIRVRLAEPDLLMEFNGEWIGVAAKRVKSRKKLVQRTKDAVKQVEGTTETGMVALNVDRLLGNVKLSRDSQARGAQFEAEVPELAAALTFVESRPRIKALLVLGFSYKWIEEGGTPRLDMTAFYKWQFFPNDDAEHAYVESFQADFVRLLGQRLQRF